MIKKIILTILLALTFNQVASAETTKLPIVYIFHSDTCPHCQHEIAWFKRHLETNPDLIVKTFELNQKDNKKLWEAVAKATKVEASGTPYTVINEQVIEGYASKPDSDNPTVKEILASIKQEGKDIVAEVIANNKFDSQVEILQPTPKKEPSNQIPAILIITGVIIGLIILFKITSKE